MFLLAPGRGSSYSSVLILQKRSICITLECWTCLSLPPAETYLCGFISSDPCMISMHLSDLSIYLDTVEAGLLAMSTIHKQWEHLNQRAIQKARGMT